MKKILIALSFILSVSCFSQNIKYNAQGRIVSNTINPAWIDSTNGVRGLNDTFTGIRNYVDTSRYYSIEWFGYNIHDSITDQSSILQTAVNYLGSRGGGGLGFPTAVYNAGMNNTWSNISFIMNGHVKVKKVWHFAVGVGPNIAPTDPNYSLTVKYSENNHIVGPIEFSDGGRLGTFYSNNCSADFVKLSGNHDGIHLYSNTHNFSIGEIYSEGGRHDAGNAGTLFIDKIGDSTAVPENIHVGKMYSEGAYYLGLVLTVNGFTCDELIVKKAGLSGLRIEDGTGIHIGSVIVDSCGYFPTEFEFIRTGVTIGGVSKNVIIDNIKATRNNSYQVMVYNPNTTDVHLGNVEASNSDSSSVYFKDVKRVTIDNLKSFDAPYPLEIDNAKNVKINYAELYNGSKSGLVIKSSFDDLDFGTLLIHDNVEDGFALAGGGKMVINDLKSYKIGGNHIFAIGFSGELNVKKFMANGAATLSYYNALAMQAVKGTVTINEMSVDSFNATGSKAIYAYADSGQFNFPIVNIKNTSVGYDIEASHNTGFKFGRINYTNVATHRTAYPYSTIADYVGADTIPPVSGQFAQGDRWKNSGYRVGAPSEWVYHIDDTWKPIGFIGNVDMSVFGKVTLEAETPDSVFTIFHGQSGVSTTSKVFITARSTQASGFTYADVDSTKITIYYPANKSGTMIWDWSIMK